MLNRIKTFLSPVGFSAKHLIVNIILVVSTGLAVHVYNSPGVQSTAAAGSLQERVIGSYGLPEDPSTALTIQSLNSEELDAITESETKLYEAERDVIAGRFVLAFFTKMKQNNSLSSTAAAQHQFFAENAKVVDSDIDTFIQKNIQRKEISSASEADRKKMVRQFLEVEKRGQALIALVDGATKRGEIVVARAVPVPARFKIELNQSPSLGSAQSPIKIIIFSDFQCPFCAQFAALAKKLQTEMPDKVQLVHKDMPLTGLHPAAMLAAAVGRCAQEQGKFWEVSDILYREQRELQKADQSKFIESIAKSGVNTSLVSSCLTEKRADSLILSDMKLSETLDLTGTPSIFINGLRFRGVMDEAALRALIERELDRLAH